MKMDIIIYERKEPMPKLNRNVTVDENMIKVLNLRRRTAVAARYHRYSTTRDPTFNWNGSIQDPPGKQRNYRNESRLLDLQPIILLGLQANDELGIDERLKRSIAKYARLRRKSIIMGKRKRNDQKMRDVIGELKDIENIEEWENNGNKTKRLTFELEDKQLLGGQEISSKISQISTQSSYSLKEDLLQLTERKFLDEIREARQST
ncbi:hypothetical protein Taro_019547 [Colocasia esculenta]|uniref:Uncharacterized protein n=1 Tax=Colocasia esculenta TaxID=4460 RepID=A0A843V2I6_COLES|nr:hypothetical protein [Colocasia esculenta]